MPHDTYFDCIKFLRLVYFFMHAGMQGRLILIKRHRLGHLVSVSVNHHHHLEYLNMCLFFIEGL